MKRTLVMLEVGEWVEPPVLGADLRAAIEADAVNCRDKDMRTNVFPLPLDGRTRSQPYSASAFCTWYAEMHHASKLQQTAAEKQRFRFRLGEKTRGCIVAFVKEFGTVEGSEWVIDSSLFMPSEKKIDFFWVSKKQ
jgi:hypothetical protein